MSLADERPAYEQSGLAKPASPMLRRSGSTAEGGVGHSQPALPQLSRTGDSERGKLLVATTELPYPDALIPVSEACCMSEGNIRWVL